MKKSILNPLSAILALVLCGCAAFPPRASGYPAVLFNPTNGVIIIPTNFVTANLSSVPVTNNFSGTATNLAGNALIQATNIATAAASVAVTTNQALSGAYPFNLQTAAGLPESGVLNLTNDLAARVTNGYGGIWIIGQTNNYAPETTLQVSAAGTALFNGLYLTNRNTASFSFPLIAAWTNTVNTNLSIQNQLGTYYLVSNGISFYSNEGLGGYVATYYGPGAGLPGAGTAIVGDVATPAGGGIAGNGSGLTNLLAGDGNAVVSLAQLTASSMVQTNDARSLVFSGLVNATNLNSGANGIGPQNGGAAAPISYVGSGGNGSIYGAYSGGAGGVVYTAVGGLNTGSGTYNGTRAANGTNIVGNLQILGTGSGNGSGFTNLLASDGNTVSSLVQVTNVAAALAQSAVTFTNAAGAKFTLVVNASTNGFVFVPH